MANKVKLSKDGSSIDFVQSDSLPTSTKKFRQSPEIEGFYRFIFENGLQKEAHEILEQIIQRRKAAKGTKSGPAKGVAADEVAAQKLTGKAAKTPATKVPPKPAGKVATAKKPEPKTAKAAPQKATKAKAKAKPAKKTSAAKKKSRK